jgi:hypothetical protein
MKIGDDIIYQVKYGTFGNYKYTRDQIRKRAQKISDKMIIDKPNSKHFAVVLKFEDASYRNNGFTNPGEQVQVYEEDDYDGDGEEMSIVGFLIYFSV